MAPGDTSSAERKSLQREDQLGGLGHGVEQQAREHQAEQDADARCRRAPSSTASPSTRRSTCRRGAPTQRRSPICCRRAATLVETALATTKTAARSASPEMPESSVR